MPTINDASSIYMPNRAIEERERRELSRIRELEDILARTKESKSWEATNSIRVDHDTDLALTNIDCNIDNLFNFLSAERDNLKRAEARCEEYEILVMRMQRHIEELEKTNKTLVESVKDLAEGVLGPKTFYVPNFVWTDPKSLLPVITRRMSFILTTSCKNALLQVKKYAADLFPNGITFNDASKWTGLIKSPEEKNAFRDIANTAIFMENDPDADEIMINMAENSAEARSIADEFRIGWKFTNEKNCNDFCLLSRFVTLCSEACHRVRKKA